MNKLMQDELKEENIIGVVPSHSIFYSNYKKENLYIKQKKLKLDNFIQN